MTIARILLTGDILRPTPGDPERSESVRRIRWFEDLLTPPLALVTDVPVQRLACDGPHLDFRAVYADCGTTPSIGAWAQLYAADLPPRLCDRLAALCRDALVVGVEMAPSVVRALGGAGVPVIDCAVDPHRFLSDIPLAWRSTDAGVRRALEPFGVSRFDVQHQAARIKAKARWMFEVAVPEGATLVLDQVPGDSAMIDPQRGRMVGWADYLPQVMEIRARGPVLWRSHPQHPHDGPLSGILGEACRTTANFYHLLAHDHLTGVAAISSGGVVEARAFGKIGTHLLDRLAGIRLPAWRSPVPVIGHWLSPHFWSAVLAPLLETRPGVPILPVEKNVLRRTINCDWEFSWIDQLVVVKGPVKE